jgi:hypothetical protein
MCEGLGLDHKTHLRWESFENICSVWGLPGQAEAKLLCYKQVILFGFEITLAIAAGFGISGM